MAFPWSRKTDNSAFMPRKQEQQQQTDTPNYVKKEDFDQAVSTLNNINTQFQQFQGFISGLATGQGAPAGTSQVQQVQQLPDIQDVTDEEYQQALIDGDAKKLRTRHAADMERQKRQFDSRFTELESRGMGVLDVVSNQASQQALATQKFYPLIKDKVDAKIAKIPAPQRTPEMVSFLYRETVGENFDALSKWERAEETRIAAEREAGMGTPTRGSGGSRTSEDEVTFSSTFGEELSNPVATWKGGGRVWDKFNVQDHAKRRYGLDGPNELAQFARGVMATDDCHQCFSPIVNGKCFCRNQ